MAAKKIKQKQSSLEVKMVSIGSIKQYENNPRINDQAVDAVAESIKAFGFRQPIVVDKKSIIIVGHTRYKAALRLGMKEVPVHVAALSAAEAKAYRLVDNKTNEGSKWNPELLEVELDGLKELEFDLTSIGFDDSLPTVLPDNMIEIEQELRPFKTVHILVSVPLSKSGACDVLQAIESIADKYGAVIRHASN